MLFSKKIPLPLKNKQKNRTFLKFKFYYNNKSYFRLKSLGNYRFFINHIKLVNFFFRKSVSKFKRGSRKEYYKGLKGGDNRVKFRMKIKKRIIKRFSFKGIFKNKSNFLKLKIKNFFMTRYRRISNNYICFNSKKLPFSKKSTNSRMGKGKGNIKNWFLNTHSGKTVFYLLGWHTDIAIYVLNTVRVYLPGNYLIILPFLKKFNKNFFKNKYYQ